MAKLVAWPDNVPERSKVDDTLDFCGGTAAEGIAPAHPNFSGN